MISQKRKILVVEDDKSIAKVIEIFLSQQGFKVDKVESAEEAIELATNDDYDFFIVDLVLTGENGFEFVRKIRKVPKYFRVPILIMTAKMESEDEDVAIVAGADGLLIKPFELEDMAKTVEKLFYEKNS